jgi:holo-[acyl-carrier protein] synthase
MILGIGLDIVEIKRIHKSIENSQDTFLKKIFTDTEIEKSKRFSNLELKSKHFAKRFAAKEAFSKAIGLGIGRGVNFTDIEVVNDENGKPSIHISNNTKLFLKKHFQNSNFQIDLSLSDEKEIAQAIVIISKC